MDGAGDRELTFFCNDAYRPTLGRQAALGAGRALATGLGGDLARDRAAHRDACSTTGEATWDEGLLLFLERSGYPEETYHTFSYSPLPDDDGGVAGMLCVVTEETERVIGERRLATLRELARELAGAQTEPRSAPRVERGLGSEPPRPAVRPRSTCSTRTAVGAPARRAPASPPAIAAAPALIRLADAGAPWPAASCC